MKSSPATDQNASLSGFVLDNEAKASLIWRKSDKSLAEKLAPKIKLLGNGNHNMKGSDSEDGRKTRGFASMTPERRRQLAMKGGKSVPREKRTFSLDRALASEAGRKGGRLSPFSDRASSSAESKSGEIVWIGLKVESVSG